MGGRLEESYERCRRFSHNSHFVTRLVDNCPFNLWNDTSVITLLADLLPGVSKRPVGLTAWLAPDESLPKWVRTIRIIDYLTELLRIDVVQVFRMDGREPRLAFALVIFFSSRKDHKTRPLGSCI